MPVIVTSVRCEYLNDEILVRKTRSDTEVHRDKKEFHRGSEILLCASLCLLCEPLCNVFGSGLSWLGTTCTVSVPAANPIGIGLGDLPPIIGLVQQHDKGVYRLGAIEEARMVKGCFLNGHGGLVGACANGFYRQAHVVL